MMTKVETILKSEKLEKNVFIFIYTLQFDTRPYRGLKKISLRSLPTPPDIHGFTAGWLPWIRRG